MTTDDKFAYAFATFFLAMIALLLVLGLTGNLPNDDGDPGYCQAHPNNTSACKD
jgi:hypothetical protein